MGVVELIMIFCVPEEVPRGNDAPLRPLIVMDDLPLLLYKMLLKYYIRILQAREVSIKKEVMRECDVDD